MGGVEKTFAEFIVLILSKDIERTHRSLQQSVDFTKSLTNCRVIWNFESQIIVDLIFISNIIFIKWWFINGLLVKFSNRLHIRFVYYRIDMIEVLFRYFIISKPLLYELTGDVEHKFSKFIILMNFTDIVLNYMFVQQTRYFF